ncbi:MAG: flagellar biosynthetic protein FliR, partial [Sulfitobacter sp.]|nr:flagellar biosynthetic protein FliR [Sulfitobacter sp.]
MTLETYVTTLFFSYLVVFARLGSALIFMPSFGEVQIPIRARLSFALVMCAALLPATPVQAAMPSDPIALV